MNWARDNDFLSDSNGELSGIFQYESRPTTVISIATTSPDHVHARVASLESSDLWNSWIDQKRNADESLVLILANREVAETSYGFSSTPSSIDNWLSRTHENTTGSAFKPRAAQTFENLREKQIVNPDSQKRHIRPFRALPFSLETFRSICNKFGVHRSIVRTIMRQNVPFFSSENVDMEGQAIVYNCRTPNSWPSDLALSATYYPSKATTFAILYGTTPEIERDVITRLQRVSRSEVLHPLLIPGIVAEIELSRHIRLVEKHINAIESHVISLDDNGREFSREEADRRIATKTEVWLNLTYLRNSISTWSGELKKMRDHAQDLNAMDLGTWAMRSFPSSCSNRSTLTGNTLVERVSDHWSARKAEDMGVIANIQEEHELCEEPQQISVEYANKDVHVQKMRDVGLKFQTRLDAIRDEYEEKLRDCTMRLDGMAMATQWSHSETAVEIALATNSDSKVMRSISLVTMIFLPGTFFATVFSMTFFDWKSEGDQMVSSYLWIYVVVTLLFTAATLGCWYFFVVFRNSNKSKSDEEALMP